MRKQMCDTCAWSGVHSLEVYGVWRCDYHGFHSKGKVPDCHCDEWLEKTTQEVSE